MSDSLTDCYNMSKAVQVIMKQTKQIEYLEKRMQAAMEVVEAARDSIGLMCKSGNHADGCKMCAVSAALRKFEDANV